MNRIITTDILDPTIQQPLTGNSVDFWQDANKESSLALALASIGDSYDPTKAYVLQGLQAYGTGNYTAGYVLWGGEVYYSVGKSDGIAMVNIAVMTITITNDGTADPVVFTDGVSRNVHKVRRLVLSDALTGTGTFDLSDAIFLERAISYTPTLTAVDSALVAVAGGFTAVSTTANYIIRDNSFILDVSLTGVETLATSRVLRVSYPVGFSIQTPKRLVGTDIVKFYNGTSYFPLIVNVRNLFSGSGNGIEITKTDYTDFGAFTGGDMRFTLKAFMI